MTIGIDTFNYTNNTGIWMDYSDFFSPEIYVVAHPRVLPPRVREMPAIFSDCPIV